MAKYTLIGSRDPFESKSVAQLYALASDLKGSGNDVTLFLVQNGVFDARGSASSSALSKLVDSGVTVVADAFSLRERGIDGGKLASGIKAGEVDLIIDHMAEGRKVVWH